MLYMSIGAELWRGIGIALIVLICGGILAIIGIQREHLTKLRDEKANLEIKNKDLEKKLEEAEKELMKYDKKRRKDKSKSSDNTN